MIKINKNKKRISLDLTYNSLEISKFINILMESGKKSKAKNLFKSSLNYIKFKMKANPLEIFFSALNNIAPMIEIKKKKIFGVNQNILSEIKKKRRISLAMKWLKNFSKLRKEKKFFLKLGNEIIDAYYKRGLCIKKKLDFHKLTLINKI